jgi:S-adenosylmethionine:tRNA ribosyltransferase-isomerase
MHISEFDYQLPLELIAQFPAQCRDQSRLLLVNRARRNFEHAGFTAITDVLRPGDALVLNDTKVKPARLIGRAGAHEVDILLVERVARNLYLVKAKPGKKIKPGVRISFQDGRYTAVCRETSDECRGMKCIAFESAEDIESVLGQIGMMPLPPYIKRRADEQDAVRYQTVYAKNLGAIAAPTAGLHFTPEILEHLRQKQVRIVYVTLSVGLGTFVPVRVEDISEHAMHAESYELTAEAAALLEQVRGEKGRICAVGTTVCRVLESCAENKGGVLRMVPGKGVTDIFIYPPYVFKATDMLLTNFHFPRTTLLMLVSAFTGKELALRAYEEAVRQRYRFYSYGDCMLIT